MTGQSDRVARDREAIAQMRASGMSRNSIAEVLGVSPETVGRHARELGVGFGPSGSAPRFTEAEDAIILAHKGRIKDSGDGLLAALPGRSLNAIRQRRYVLTSALPETVERATRYRAPVPPLPVPDRPRGYSRAEIGAAILSGDGDPEAALILAMDREGILTVAR